MVHVLFSPKQADMYWVYLVHNRITNMSIGFMLYMFSYLNLLVHFRSVLFQIMQ